MNTKERIYYVNSHIQNVCIYSQRELEVMSEKKSRYQLQKLVTKLREFDYTVRFEKGNFKTGYCILEDRKIIVVNKFHDVEARIHNLREILSFLVKKAAQFHILFRLPFTASPIIFYFYLILISEFEIHPTRYRHISRHSSDWLPV